MRLRTRLVAFSTIQLVVFGALGAIAYWQLAHQILPAFERDLGEKTMYVVGAIGGQSDVALATDDAKLAAAVIGPYVGDPDFAYVGVRAADGHMLLAQGSPIADAFAGPAHMLSRAGDHVVTWVPVALEGVPLGSVAVAFSSARIDRVATWASRIAFTVALIWMLAIGYSFRFARSFVAPLGAMMRFSHEVARGTLTERLKVDARDELRGLQQDLNAMAADLERREAERRRRADEAEQMQHALLDMSRTAGMAEVATNVLHNVGNVLNSLNVSATMIVARVRESKVSALSRTIETVERAPGGLPAFLSTERGKALPEYLSALSTRLREENADVLAELESVLTNVEHIKTIIATQQSYAHNAGLVEQVSLGGLIDDSLRMSEMSFARHGIAVVKDYGDNPSLRTDRHKLLGVLINVVTNARHSLKASGAKQLELRVHVRRTERGVSIAISDTGVGIPSENLVKIFQHGFTTKANGHGFGLHASANAVQELGGSISARSDGPGQGAEFVIELPSEMPEGSAT